MEIVLLGYFLINICQIFSLGGFLTNVTVVKVRAVAWRVLMVVVLRSTDRIHHRDNMGAIPQCANRIPMAGRWNTNINRGIRSCRKC